MYTCYIIYVAIQYILLNREHVHNSYYIGLLSREQCEYTHTQQCKDAYIKTLLPLITSEGQFLIELQQYVSKFYICYLIKSVLSWFILENIGILGKKQRVQRGRRVRKFLIFQLKGTEKCRPGARKIRALAPKQSSAESESMTVLPAPS